MKLGGDRYPKLQVPLLRKAKRSESRGHRKVSIKAGPKNTKKVKAFSPQTLGVSYVSCGTSVVEDSKILCPK